VPSFPLLQGDVLAVFMAASLILRAKSYRLSSKRF